MIDDTELRRIVNDAIARAKPSELQDRLRGALRSSANTNYTYRRHRRKYFQQVFDWAADHLQASLDSDTPAVRGIDAFHAFDPDAGAKAKPTLFYRALEDAGFVIDHDGQFVVIPDTELLP